MYIGPWQEYRLAKLQDDTIQRIRLELEDKLRTQISDSDDKRVRELMQPLMDKLPSLLLASKSTDRSSGSRKATRPPPASVGHSRQSSRPSTAMSMASSTPSHGDRSVSAPTGKTRQDGSSNQETHDTDPDAAVLSHPRNSIPRQASGKKKKKKSRGTTTQQTALGEVEKRKKMFSKWLKASQEAPETTALSNESSTTTASEATRLPPIHPERQAQRSESSALTEPTRLPPLLYHDLESVSHDEPHTQAPTPSEELNLEDSLDEDEVNQLLNWTDNLLSPNALESSLTGLDDSLDIG